MGFSLGLSPIVNKFPPLSEVIFCCFVTSLIWGVTNPLIRRNTRGINQIQPSPGLRRFYFELKYLVLNWKYVLLFLINQSGSLFYFLLLQNADLSLIVPLTNALTLIFTAVFGILLGEEKPSLGLFFGTCLIFAGIGLCVLDSTEDRTEIPI